MNYETQLKQDLTKANEKGLLNNFGKLQLELLTKGKDYVLESIPPEDIHTEEDLYEYPISEYEELYDLTINEKWYDNKKEIQSICLELDETILGEYITTRLNV